MILRLMYKNGQCVARSDEKAVELFTMAAEQDHPAAQYNSEPRYRTWPRGGCPQNDKQAFRVVLLRLPSKVMQGPSLILGLCIKRAKGLQKSDEKAAEWYTKAAEQGDADAQYNLGLMYLRG